MLEYVRMKTNQGKKSFLGCCKDSIGTTLIITQVAAVVIAIVLSVYGSGKFYAILILTFLFSNSIGLSTHILFAAADYFRIVPYSEEKKRFRPSSVLLTLGGMLTGSEITMLMDNLFLGYMKIPFWYLEVIGVDPPYQGKGFANMLLKPMLRRIDKEHFPIWLDTVLKRNVSFYEHFDFIILEEIIIPNTNIVNWFMIRESEI